MKRQRLGLYRDVRDTLDLALTHNGGSLTLATHGAAKHWQQRAYRFRKAYAESLATEETIYDRLIFPRIPPESSTVVIRIRETPGLFTPAEPPTFDASIDSDLFNIATSLAAKIEKDEI